MSIAIAPLADPFGTCIQSDGQTPLLALDPAEVRAHFRASGVVLFRGFGASPEEFKQFSGQLSTHFMPYRGGAIPRPQVGDDSTVLAVTGSHLRYAVSLHGEMYYMKQRPSIIWFYCAVPADEDGETTVADGEASVLRTPATGDAIALHQARFSLRTHLPRRRLAARLPNRGSRRSGEHLYGQ